MWTAKSFSAFSTWMQMWFPSWNKGRKEKKKADLKATVWDEYPRSHLEIKHIKQTLFFSFRRPECALYDVYVHVPPLCTIHTWCKLSIRPILEIFHLGADVFPIHVMFFLALLEDVLGLYRKPLWQVWEDILCSYKSQPKCGVTASLQSLLLTTRWDFFSQYTQLFFEFVITADWKCASLQFSSGVIWRFLGMVPAAVGSRL